MQPDREIPAECAWIQIHAWRDSWRDMGSLANENSREAPSHRECHCNIPEWAQTYTPRSWKHTRTAARHAGMFAVQSVLNMHIPADMSEPAPADTFTYEPGCRCPGRDAGRQVLCRCPLGHRRGGVTTWRGKRQSNASHSAINPWRHNLPSRAHERKTLWINRMRIATNRPDGFMAEICQSLRRLKFPRAAFWAHKHGGGRQEFLKHAQPPLLMEQTHARRTVENILESIRRSQCHSAAHGWRRELFCPRALTPDWPSWGGCGQAMSPSLSVSAEAEQSGQVHGPRPTPCHCRA